MAKNQVIRFLRGVYSPDMQLAAGEIVCCTDKKLIFIGDGQSTLGQFLEQGKCFSNFNDMLMLLNIVPAPALNDDSIIYIPGNDENVANLAILQNFNTNTFIVPQKILGYVYTGQGGVDKIKNGDLTSNYNLYAVTQIGVGGLSVYSGTGSLTSIVIPASVTTIAYGAFKYNYAVKIVLLGEIPPTIDSDTFPPVGNLSNTFKIYVPANSLNTYKMETNWSNYANYIYAIEL